jgi:signal transduction histidine kinase
VRPLLRKTPFKLDLQSAPDLVIDGYPGALSQALINLIDNCLTHAFPDRSSGCIEIIGRAGPGGQVEVIVRDDGVGIPQEVQPRIFEPFYTSRPNSGGSGLGLHIVRNIVTNILGGQINVASSPNKGAEFTLVLPTRAPNRSIASTEDKEAMQYAAA